MHLTHTHAHPHTHIHTRTHRDTNRHTHTHTLPLGTVSSSTTCLSNIPPWQLRLIMPSWSPGHRRTDRKWTNNNKRNETPPLTKVWLCGGFSERMSLSWCWWACGVKQWEIGDHPWHCRLRNMRNKPVALKLLNATSLGPTLPNGLLEFHQSTKCSENTYLMGFYSGVLVSNMAVLYIHNNNKKLKTR